jgi:hypothetical protein
VTVIEPLRRGVLGSLIVAHIGLGIVTLTLGGEPWTLLAWIGFTVVGALILMARTGVWIGRLMLAQGLGWAVAGTMSLPGAALAVPLVVEIVIVWLGFALWLLVPLIALVFPSGRLESRLGVAIVAVIAGVWMSLLIAVVVSPAPLLFSDRVNPFGIAGLADVTAFVIGDGTFVIVPIIVAATLIDVVMRWRRASGARALQFRWLAYGTALTVTVIVVMVIATTTASDWLWIVGLVLMVGINAIPVSIGVAVTRHGLYEIGRIVSRTVAYSLVTVLVVSVYVGVVSSVTWLLPALPTVGVAVATLAAAALALPALRAVQRLVDRRFDRERYDARALVEGYGQRLRSGADPETNSRDLLDVVDRALRPTSIALWSPQEQQ